MPRTLWWQNRFASILSELQISIGRARLASSRKFLDRQIFSTHRPMNENSKDSRLVSGDGPINRRTANREHLRELHQSTSVSPEAIARAERSQARSALGAGLEQQVQSFQTQVHQAPTAFQIIAAIVLACGVITALLAVLQTSRVLGGVACGLLVLGSIGVFKWMRQLKGSASARGIGASAPIFDEKSLRAFDDALEAASPDLSSTASTALRQIKTTLAKVAEHAGPTDEHFTQDDRMFLVECLRRYIPDSLEAYLRVPREQRSHALLPEASSAEAAFAEQLSILSDEIEKRGKKIGRSAAEDLMKQRRFLESKKTR